LCITGKVLTACDEDPAIEQTRRRLLSPCHLHRGQNLISSVKENCFGCSRSVGVAVVSPSNEHKAGRGIYERRGMTGTALTHQMRRLLKASAAGVKKIDLPAAGTLPRVEAARDHNAGGRRRWLRRIRSAAAHIQTHQDDNGRREKREDVARWGPPRGAIDAHG